MKKTIGLLSAVALSSAAYAHNHVHFNGGVEAGFTWLNDDGNGDATMNFGVLEAIMSATGTSGNTHGHIDYNVQTNNVTQAYVGAGYDGGLSWKLGQFNRILGFDPVYRTQAYYSISNASQGFARGEHTGLLLSYDLSDALAVHFLVDHANDVGTNLSDDLGIGFKVESKSDNMEVYAGVVFDSVEDEDSAWDADLGLKTRMGNIGLGVNVALYGHGEDMGMAFGVAGMMPLSESQTLFGRIEWDNTGAGSDEVAAARNAGFLPAGNGKLEEWSRLQVSAGLVTKMSDAFSVRTGVSFATFMGDNAEDTDSKFGVGLSGVYRF